MDEARRATLDESNRILSKLQLLAVFFGDDMIYKIYLRNQVIHQLFENNEELDVNKLELYHVQFTQALIDLLRKIKKNNEQNVTVLLDEMQLNRDLITQIESTLLTRETFLSEQQRQATRVNNSLRKLYEALSNDSSDYPFAKNINSFSARFAADFFDEISASLFQELIAYRPEDAYRNAYAIIQKKLMGLLCKYDFRTSFFTGLACGDTVIEIYRINDTERYYLFLPAKAQFLLVDYDKIAHVQPNSERSKKEAFVQELKDKNFQIENNISLVKTTLPANIKDLLTENYRKLNDMDFLQKISEIDVQANILRTMLNTDMI